MDYSKALEIATKAHAGQMRKDGEEYINHPIRVSNSVFVNDVDVLTEDEILVARIVSLLHDVVEDSSVTVNDLADDGFTWDVLDAVILLTREDGITYLDYVNNLLNSQNKIAIAVKLGDLTDNINSSITMDDKKLNDLRANRWEPTYDKLVAVWLDFPSLDLMEE